MSRATRTVPNSLCEMQLWVAAWPKYAPMPLEEWTEDTSSRQAVERFWREFAAHTHRLNWPSANVVPNPNQTLQDAKQDAARRVGLGALEMNEVPTRWEETFGYVQSTGHHAIWLPNRPLRTVEDVLAWLDEQIEQAAWIDQNPTAWAPWQDDYRALEWAMITNPVWKDAPFGQAIGFGAIKGALLWLADRGFVSNDALIPKFKSRLELLRFSDSLRGKLETLAFTGHQNVTSNVKPPDATVPRDPEAVCNLLTWYRQILAGDVGSLRLIWPSLVQKRWPKHETVSALDYLRSHLTTFRTFTMSAPTNSNAAAWHEYVLDYCRTLGADAVAVDRLYQRLGAGDVTDRRAVESDAEPGLEQLRIAIDRAHEQWLSGDPVIRTPDSNSGEVPSGLEVTLNQMSWLVGGTPSVGTMRNHKKKGRPKPLRQSKGRPDIWRYSDLAEWVKQQWPTVIVPDECAAREQLANRPNV